MAKGFRGKKVFDDMGEDLFGEHSIRPSGSTRIGRSPDMIAQRNERLIARLYWYRRYHPDMRNESILMRLHHEFDLERSTIPQILAQLTAELVEFKKKAPSIEELEERWGWMKWR